MRGNAFLRAFTRVNAGQVPLLNLQVLSTQPLKVGWSLVPCLPGKWLRAVSHLNFLMESRHFLSVCFLHSVCCPRALFAKVKVRVWQNFIEDKKTTRAPGQQLHRGTWSWAETSRVPLVKWRVLFRKPMEAMTIEVALKDKLPSHTNGPSY